MEDNSVEIQYGEDRGDRLFKYDDTNGVDSSVKLKKALKSPMTYYFLVVLLALLGWIIYGYAFAPKESVVRQSNVGEILKTIIVYVMLSAITVVMVFGLWEKLLKFASRGSQDTVANDKLMQSNGKTKYRSALAVYETYFEIVNLSVSKFYEKSEVRSIMVKSGREYFTVILILRNVRYAAADVVIPAEFLGNFIRACGDIEVNVENYSRRKEKIILDKSVGALIGITLFLLLPIVVGALLIWLHYAVDAKVPAFLGVFFILGGATILCGPYSFIPFVKRVLMPLMSAITFTVGPMFLVSAMLQDKGFALTAYNFIHSLDAVVLGMTYFFSIGLFVLPYAVRMAIDYFVYSVRKK